MNIYLPAGVAVLFVDDETAVKSIERFTARLSWREVSEKAIGQLLICQT
jgi:hypothetical protein